MLYVALRCRDDVLNTSPSIFDVCTSFALRERIVVLQGGLIRSYFLAVGLRRILEFELDFRFSEVAEKVKVMAISYQQLPSHITYRQVIRWQGSVLCLLMAAKNISVK